MVWSDFGAESLKLGIHFSDSIFDSEVKCKSSVEDTLDGVSDVGSCSAGSFSFHSAIQPCRCRCTPSPLNLTPVIRGRRHSDGRDCYRKRKAKNVHFADDFGLDLTEVRHYVISSEEGFRWACSVTSMYDNDSLWENEIKEEKTSLQIGFSQPGVEPNFHQRVQGNAVSLENCLTDNESRKITGIVRVANRGFSKRVIIRSSTNNWVTYEDIEARYVPNSSDGSTDRFIFTITVPWFMAKGGRVDFAVRFICGDETYWDNNENKNYTVFC